MHNSCVLKFYFYEIYRKSKSVKTILENGLAWLGLPIIQLGLLSLSQKFLNNTAEIFQYNGSLNYSNFTPEEWKYYNVLEQFYTYSTKFSNNMDWPVKNIGSFFIKSLRYDILKKDKSHMDKIHQLFTISGENISLPDLAQMYTTMDFRELRQFSYNFRNGLSRHYEMDFRSKLQF